VTPFGRVAAVCIYPRFVAPARDLLADTGVRLATVVNLPRGDSMVREIYGHILAAIADGADEIDMVMPRHVYASGERERPLNTLDVARNACGTATLEVILETGLSAAEIVAAASRDAIACGADFLETSTGKIAAGATPEAAEIMLRAIREHRDCTDKTIGLEAAGGICSVAEAAVCMGLAERIMAPDYVRPATFRIGASGPLDDVPAVLKSRREAVPRAGDGY